MMGRKRGGRLPVQEPYDAPRVLLALARLIGRACRRCTCGACEELEAMSYQVLADAPDPERKEGDPR